MVLDRNAINMILALDDSQLKFIINRLAVNAGIDLGYFGLKQQDITALRQRLAGLSDAELAEAQRQIDAKGKKGHG